MIPSAYVIPGLPDYSIISLNRIIDVACDVFQTNRVDLFSGSRKQDPKTARQVIMWFCMKYLNYKTGEAGDVFGLNHATAIHSNKVVHNFIDIDSDFKSRVKLFKYKLGIL